ncbi:MAG TPA: hypothetical protein VNT92_12740 [Acidimicrobiia bacterium]|nr:hypothetical protein [Acidimicrobiia bacterium]
MPTTAAPEVGRNTPDKHALQAHDAIPNQRAKARNCDIPQRAVFGKTIGARPGFGFRVRVVAAASRATGSSTRTAGPQGSTARSTLARSSLESTGDPPRTTAPLMGRRHIEGVGTLLDH